MAVADLHDAAPRVSTGRITALCGAMVAVGPLAMALYTPAMPAVAADMGVSSEAVKMTLTAYFAGFSVAQLVSGPLSDALGRKAVLHLFMGLFVLATLWALTAEGIEALIAARAMQGVGASAGIAVSRAVVRDLFTGEKSSHVMNGIGLVLAVGPAAAPVIGGLTLEFLPWHSVFALMLIYAVFVMVAIERGLPETVQRDPSRFRPIPLMRSYGTLLRSSEFLSSTLMIGGGVGAIYAQATLLPFALIEGVGLSASEFGMAMLAQTGSFFCGSLVVRRLMARHSSRALAPWGLVFFAIGGALNLPHLFGIEPTLLNIIGPVAVYAFGIGFVMPFAMTAAMAPFPRIAGAASALTGFFQMGAGLVGGMAGALFADPAAGLGMISPVMGAAAAVGWFWWKSCASRPSAEEALA